jgi:hypothetical protein
MTNLEVKNFDQVVEDFVKELEKMRWQCRETEQFKVTLAVLKLLDDDIRLLSRFLRKAFSAGFSGNMGPSSPALEVEDLDKTLKGVKCEP